MRVRKLNSEWTPSENKSLQVGEIIDISNPKSLVDQGLAIYVDENDRDYEKIPVAWEYRPATKKVETAPVEEKKEKELTPEEKRQYIKTQKILILEKARKAKKQKELERQLKEQEEITDKARKDAIDALNQNPL